MRLLHVSCRVVCAAACLFCVSVGKRTACRPVAICRGPSRSNRVFLVSEEIDASVIVAPLMVLKDPRRVLTCPSFVKDIAASAPATSLIGRVIAVVQAAVLPGP